MSVGVRHNFETAHRLPFLGGKCVNLHGHSWQVQVEVTAPDTRHGVLVDFGALKTRPRSSMSSSICVSPTAVLMTTGKKPISAPISMLGRMP